MKGKNGEYKDAIDHFTESLSLFETQYLDIVHINAVAFDYRVIELDPKYADAYNNRGRVRQYPGDTSGACSDWQRALALGIEDTRELIMKYCK